ncbi:hypothetical protein GC089_06055 [Cellulomonas sp. JZ18]|uniref:UDP-N-acetylglucosamine 2-epimerase n=1 Tax=Cellulomonas sp. JZ18 TaxID=2654191 RepID=UPI0012D47805|nr:UDP-N-acetylglucosamine 2-epimerase [Cellulomonas sp. JZ18]QGQ18883.1 hypothetical protein GC089_06055 [Cellulomonas sp. JZ18]
MIIFVYGTTAEAIKLAPVVSRLRERGVPVEQWLTYQHTEALDATMGTLGLGRADVVVARGRRGAPLKTPVDMVVWLLSVAGWTVRNALRQRRRLDRRRDVVVVHGDTVTSVVGALLARCVGLRSAHVEAGLRSGDWRHPFPEELDRRIVGRLASVHYAPSEEACANLRGRSGVVHTHGNTVMDAALDSTGAVAHDGAPYGVVLLHRFEFISDPARVRDTLRLLAEHADVPLKVLVDAYARDAIVAAIDELGAGDRLLVQPKLSHGDFIQTLRDAALVVTDSGGVQEEAALYGVPTLVHRMATERSEGLGANALLSYWKPEVVRDFLTGYRTYRVDVPPPAVSPSQVVVDDLLARGYGR